MTIPDTPSTPQTTTHCGFAKRHAGAEMAAAAAAAFAGLPEGFTHPQQLLVVLREAGPLLPFPRAALTTLETLVDWTRAEHWRAGRQPLVWPSNHEIAARCNVDEATVGRHLQALRTAGVIAVHYGPGNRRSPIFEASGNIVEAYGIDLSPLAELAARLRPQLIAARSRRQALRRQRHTITALLQEAEGRLAAVIALPRVVDADQFEILTGAARHLDQIARAARTITRAFTTATPTHQDKLESDLAALVQDAEDAADASRDAALQIFREAEELQSALRTGADLGNKQIPISDVSSGPCTRSRRSGGGDCSDKDPPQDGFDTWHPVSIDPPARAPKWDGAMLAGISPTFKALFGNFTGRNPATATVDDVRFAGRIATLALGLSEKIWQKAVEQHGPLIAALAAFLASDKPIWQIRESRAAFLAALFRRPTGDLHPLASLFGLARARAAGPAAA